MKNITTVKIILPLYFTSDILKIIIFVFLIITVGIFLPNATASSLEPLIQSVSINEGNGNLSITFDKEIDVTPSLVDVSKIHIREKNTRFGGFSLSLSELTTTINSSTILFTLTEVNRQKVLELNTPWLSLEDAAFIDTTGNNFKVSFDVSGANLVNQFDAYDNSQNLTLFGLAVNDDGEKLFVYEANADEIRTINLPSSYDLTGATRGHTEVIDIDGADSRDITFSSNGTKLFILDTFGGNSVKLFTLTNPFDTSSLTNDPPKSWDIVPSFSSSLVSLTFSSNGTKMYILSSGSSGELYEYTLSNPYNHKSAVFIGSSPIAQSAPRSMQIVDDGNILLISGSSSDIISHHDLTNPYDTINNVVYDPNKFLDMDPPMKTMRSFVLSPDGMTLFAVGSSQNTIYQYMLGTFDMEIRLDVIPPTFSTSLLNEGTGLFTVTFDETIDISTIDPTKFYIRETGFSTGGVVLSAAELTTSINSKVLSFTLTEENRVAVVALATPQLDMDAAAIQDISGNPNNEVSDGLVSSACSIDISGLDFGKVSRGKVGIEVNDIWPSTGTGAAKLELTSSNWIGVDDGLVHLQSQITRFNITTDGTSSSNSYEDKTPIGANGIKITLVPRVESFESLNVSFQVTAIDPALENLPFIGDLTQEFTFTVTCLP